MLASQPDEFVRVWHLSQGSLTIAASDQVNLSDLLSLTVCHTPDEFVRVWHLSQGSLTIAASDQVNLSDQECLTVCHTPDEFVRVDTLALLNVCWKH